MKLVGFFVCFFFLYFLFFYEMIPVFGLQIERDYRESVSGCVQIKGKKTIQSFPKNSPGNSTVSWILSKHASFQIYNM